MEDSAFLLVLPPLLLVPAMGLLSMIRAGHGLGQELKRKALHVGIGLIALSFPLVLREHWMVFTGLALAVAWMSAVRILPCLQRHFGSVLQGCGRVSMGETWFALGIAALLILADDNRLLYAIPVLILSLADAAAAIAGRSLASRELTGCLRGKTLAGCCAFFTTAVIVCLAMLGLYTQWSAGRILVGAIAVAAATCFTEALLRRGLDNLAIPLVAWTVLNTLQAGGG